MRAPKPASSRRHTLTYLADAAILTALWGLFFWRFLTPNQVDQLRFAAGDFVYQYFYPAAYLAQRLQAGVFPQWQSFAYAGHPFIGDIQNAAFYPFRLLNTVVHAGNGFTPHALEVEVLLHHLAATLFTYLLARRLTAHRVGGLVGAITFGFSGFLTGYPLLQVNFMESLAWLPLLLWSWDHAGERWGQRQWGSLARWVLLAGVLWGISILAGSPQFTLYTFYGVLTFALFRLWAAGVPSGRAWAAALAVIAAFVLIGAGIAAIQLLPTAQFLPLTLRSSLGFEEAGRGFMPYDLLQIIFPAIGGEFQALYIGVLAPGLAAIALLVVRRDTAQSLLRRRTIAFFGWSGLAAGLLAFGKHLSLFSLPYLAAPGWGLFRQQERTIAWTVLAVALLAGYGAAWLAHAWGQDETGKATANGAERATPDFAPVLVERRLANAYGVSALAALGLALVFFVGYQAGQDKLWGFTSASMYLALMLALAYAALRSRQPWLLVALLVLDLFTINAGRHGKPVVAAEAPAALTTMLADSGVFRIDNSILPGNYGALYGLEDINGISPLVSKQYRQWREAMPAARAWDLLNVKYVLTAKAELEAPATRVWEGTGPDGKPAYTYLLAAAGPRARLVGGVEVESDPAGAIARAAAPAFNPETKVVLPSVPVGFGAAADCAGDLQWQERLPERLAVAVETAQPCILVLSELDFPGWQAQIDGAPAPILLADGLLRAVAVPTGSHQVVMTYRAPLLRPAALISLVTLAAVAIGLAVLGLGRRRRQ